MPKDFTPDKLISADLMFANGILLLDQCENPTAWYLEGTGTDHDLHLRDEAAFFGKCAFRLRTRATSPAANDQVTAWRLIPFPETNLLVYRLFFAVEDISKTSAVFIRADFNDGSNAYAAGIKWMPNGTVYLKYLNSVGSYIDVSSEEPDASGGWISIEMVVNLVTHTYISTTFNGTKYSLKGLSIYNEAVTDDRYHIFEIGQVAKTAAQSVIYFDSVYIGEYLNI